MARMRDTTAPVTGTRREASARWRRRRPQHAGTDHSQLAATLLRHRFSTIGPASPMGTSNANKATDLLGILPDVGQQVPDQEADGHRGR